MGLRGGHCAGVYIVPARRALGERDGGLDHDLTVVAISFRPSGPDYEPRPAGVRRPTRIDKLAEPLKRRYAGMYRHFCTIRAGSRDRNYRSCLPLK